MSFTEKMKEVIAKGYDNTKNFLSDAAEKAGELGQKGVLKYEINKLEKEVENNFTKIGNEVYAILVEQEQHTVSAGTPEIKDYLLKIKKLENQITAKEKELAGIGGT